MGAAGRFAGTKLRNTSGLRKKCKERHGSEIRRGKVYNLCKGAFRVVLSGNPCRMWHSWISRQRDGGIFQRCFGTEECQPSKKFCGNIGGGEIDYDLNRFIEAQDTGYVYNQVLKEIKEGKKQSQRIWFIFPQIKGLGHSYNSEFYGLNGIEEAKAYLEHPVLGLRLKEITMALLDCDKLSIDEIFDFPDNLKVRSCMTLFDMISPNDVFKKVLDKYYEGKTCEKTIWRLNFRDNKLKNQIKLSRLTVTTEYALILSDYDNKEVKMEPLVKAIYLLYLNHPEGIAFKTLPSFRNELTRIYSKLRPYGLNNQAIKSIEDVTNPLLNSINEKCSRIRAAFMAQVDSSLADQYYIVGKSGEPKKIMLPRNLIIWE